MPGVTLEQRVLGMLMDSGTWVRRRELDKLTTIRLALDDVLADLVTQKRAEFDQGAGYRLAHSAVVRRAVRMLRRDKLNRAVAGEVRNGPLVLGVAQVTPEGVVGFELELPAAQGVAAQLAQAARFVSVFKEHGLKGVGHE